MGVKATYLDYIDRLRQRKPSLTNLYQFLSKPTSYDSEPCRVVSLCFNQDSKKPTVHKLDYAGVCSVLAENDDDKLPSKHATATTGGGVPEEGIDGRVLIIEDLDIAIIELLCLELNIDPMFFAGHLHLPWNGVQAQVPEQCILPSEAKRKSFSNIHYHRTVRFDNVQPPVKKLLRRMNVDRKVVVTPVSKDQYVGIAQHCISIYLCRRKTHWIGIILVDRPIGSQYLFSPAKGGSLQPINLPASLYLDGYDDFLDLPPLPTPKGGVEHDGLSRHSLLEDLVHYWSVQPPDSFNPACPTLQSLAYYPLKIVAGEWIKYVGIMYRAVKLFEYSMATSNVGEELEKLNMDMRTLQRWRRRSMSSEQKIEAILRMLKAERSGGAISADSAALSEDFEYIRATVEKFGRRLENMLPVVTSLVQIIDIRRSFDETANVSRLTVVALIFVPLAYIASLFSMSEELGPGGRYFWVYFVVAIPVTITVVLVAKSPLGLLRMLRSVGRTIQWHRRSTRTKAAVANVTERDGRYSGSQAA